MKTWRASGRTRMNGWCEPPLSMGQGWWSHRVCHVFVSDQNPGWSYYPVIRGFSSVFDVFFCCLFWEALRESLSSLLRVEGQFFCRLKLMKLWWHVYFVSLCSCPNIMSTAYQYIQMFIYTLMVFKSIVFLYMIDITRCITIPLAWEMM